MWRDYLIIRRIVGFTFSFDSLCSLSFAIEGSYSEEEEKKVNNSLIKLKFVTQTWRRPNWDIKQWSSGCNRFESCRRLPPVALSTWLQRSKSSNWVRSINSMLAVEELKKKRHRPGTPLCETCWACYQSLFIFCCALFLFLRWIGPYSIASGVSRSLSCYVTLKLQNTNNKSPQTRFVHEQRLQYERESQKGRADKYECVSMDKKLRSTHATVTFLFICCCFIDADRCQSWR